MLSGRCREVVLEACAIQPNNGTVPLKGCEMTSDQLRQAASATVSVDVHSDSSLDMGQTPATIILGRELRLLRNLVFGSARAPEDEGVTSCVENLRKKLQETHELMRHQINIASDLMKGRYVRHQSQPQIFNKGDLVWLHDPKRRKGLLP